MHIKLNKFRLLALNISPYFLGLLFVGFAVIYQYGFYLSQFIDYPLGYSADGLFTMSIAKMFAENGIIFGSYTEQLNYPYSANLDAWYPVPEKIIYYPFAILVKLFGVYTAANVIQLLTHIFSALGFIFAARFLGITRKYAFLGGVVYGLTPFIFSRGLAHLTVGAAWLVPLMSVVILKLMERLENRIIIDSRLKGVSIVCAIFGAGLSPYYSFMFGQFLGFILLISLLKKDLNFAKFVLLLIVLMVVSFSIFNISNLVNIFLYSPTNIRNLAALEVYGLKLPELFLPAGFNRLKGFAGFAQQNYYVPAYVKGELWSPYLGLVGVIGCIYFVGSQFYQYFIKGKTILNIFLLQALWIIIYSLIGGINLIAGVIGFQFIRATNRYSIWLLAIFLLYGLYRISHAKMFEKKHVFFTLTLITFGLIWVDLPPAYNSISRNDVAQKIISDKQLISYLELKNEKPKIFTLPLQVFPENGPSNNMLDYDYLRLYLNSNNVTMNYGGVKLDNTVPMFIKKFQPTAEEVNRLRAAGFTSIIINKSGYSKEQLTELLGDFSRQKLRPSFENKDYLVIQIENLDKVTNLVDEPLLMFISGWSTEELGWRWAISKNASLISYCKKKCMEHSGNKKLSFEIQSFGIPRYISIYIADLNVWRGEVGTESVEIKLPDNLKMLDGKTIKIKSHGKLISPMNGDNRKLSFRIMNISYEQ